MVEINVRNGGAYFSQRNNEVRPFGTCNDTSYVAGLSYRNVVFPPGQYSQPEDNLTTFMLNDPRVDAFYKAQYPSDYAKYIAANKDPKLSTPANEMHVVLAYGVNLWLGKQPGEACVYRTGVHTTDILFSLVRGKPVIQGGIWDSLHHITCTSGFATNQDNILQVKSAQEIDMSQLQYIIVEDPYGDFHTGYNSPNGKDIHLTPEEYKAIETNQGSDIKNGHFILL
jgi:hypothetical protein